MYGNFWLIEDARTAQSVHAVFEWLAIAGGFAFYRNQVSRRDQARVLGSQLYPVVLGCILGAGIGNKLVFWIENPHLWPRVSDAFQALMAGQSIVGGLLGGWVGVELGKQFAGVKSRTGDDFVRPILLGMVIGRVGCFLAGLNDGTYGVPTTMPWGVDFGDGIARHPTQLYECLLALSALLTHRIWSKKFSAQPGMNFRCLMLAYLGWRWFIDGFKPVPYEYTWGWSGIQWVCALSLVLIAATMWWQIEFKFHGEAKS